MAEKTKNETGWDGMRYRKLRRKRLELGWSVASVAQRLGVSAGTVWRWERGLGKPQWRHAARLGELFGTPWSELCEWDSGGAEETR